MTIELTAVYVAVPEGYIAYVEELPGANTQGATLKEARSNLSEAVTLVLEANRALANDTLQGGSPEIRMITLPCLMNRKHCIVVMHEVPNGTNMISQFLRE